MAQGFKTKSKGVSKNSHTQRKNHTNVKKAGSGKKSY